MGKNRFQRFGLFLVGASMAVFSFWVMCQQTLAQSAENEVEVPLEIEPPSQPESVVIPRFEESGSTLDPGTTQVVPMIEEDVEAVEIPKELIDDTPKVEPTAEEMTADASVEEKVSEEDSLKNKIKEIGEVSIPGSDGTRGAKPKNSGELVSDVFTRKEARTFNFTIPAPRGQILDRNGYPLAQTKVSHYAALAFPYLGPDVTDEEVLRYANERVAHVNNILGSDWWPPFKALLKHYNERRWFPYIFSGVLSEQEVDELERQKMQGLLLQPVYLRHYPQQDAMSHVIGYVGKRPPQATGEIVNEEPLWGQGLGVDGLEKAFETDLRGTPGRVNVLYEEDGTKVKEDVLSRPKPGYNIITSIDLEMQRICERLLQEKVKRGAMVIMDARNGDIMAMASYPQFNPNDFIPSISQEKYSALAEDPAKPLFPRAFRAAYPPASTFKVPVALGFLESGYISASDVYPCPSSWTIKNLTMRNWNAKGEGHMNVIGAITRSCNTWFYEVAVSAGADSMSYMAMRLGLGQKTGLPLNEVDGFIPNNRWWLDKYGHMMSDGDEAVMSIGQGKVEVTPIQVARMMAAVGNGRQVLKPRLVLQVQDMNHEIVRSFPVEVANSLNVDSYSLRTVQRGMYDVVNAGNGTGKRAYHKITVSGKTGTGQWKVANKQNIAWFAGYFPSKYPVYSFAVIYEGDPGESVSGGKMGAPVVGEFLEEYLTEENYNEVRDAANQIKEERGDEPEEYTYREPVRSIFRSGAPEETVIEEITDMRNDPRAQPRSGNDGGGLFKRIFKRNRQ